LRSLQDPHPPIAVTGLSPKSGSFIEAGKRGYQPISHQLNTSKSPPAVGRVHRGERVRRSHCPAQRVADHERHRGRGHRCRCSQAGARVRPLPLGGDISWPSSRAWALFSCSRVKA
jgi:hypothetical protein